MFNEQKHLGGVTSRTHETCLVGEPVVVKIDGHEVELSLSDAFQLCAGLAGAIERVKQSECKLMGDGSSYNVAVIAKSGSGMSMPRSKLGDGEFIYLDGMADASVIPDISALAALGAAPGFKLIFAGSDISQLAKVSGDDAAAVLANCNTRIFLKTPGEQQ